VDAWSRLALTAVANESGSGEKLQGQTFSFERESSAKPALREGKQPRRRNPHLSSMPVFAQCAEGDAGMSADPLGPLAGLFRR
jgi:hypothetical protein